MSEPMKLIEEEREKLQKAKDEKAVAVTGIFQT